MNPKTTNQRLTKELDQVQRLGLVPLMQVKAKEQSQLKATFL